MQVMSRFQQDLRLLPKGEVIRKYGLESDAQYDRLVNSSEDIPDLEPVEQIQPIEKAVPDIIREMEQPSLPEYTGQAFGRYLAISRVPEKHSACMVIPKRHQGVGDIGIIESVGHLVEHLKPGMIVLFDQFATYGREARVLGEDGQPRTHLLCEECDVLEVLRKI